MLTAAPARIVFMGSPEFALPSLRRLIDAGLNVVAVYTQPDRAIVRGRVLPPPVKHLAESSGLPLRQPASLRRPEAIAELAALRPDLLVIVAYGQILRPAVLAIPARGALNLHASLLPRGRGPAPIAAAILDGLEETGVSIMQLDEGLDTGPVLAQEREPIDVTDTAASLSERLAARGASLLVDVVPRWLAGAIVPQPQDDALATRTRLIAKEDGQIDWRLPAHTLWRQIRAYNPWPVAMTTLDGTDVRILQAWPIDSPISVQSAPPDATPLQPGAILALAGRVDLPAELPRPAFAVQTGDGLLLPLLLQRAGKRVLSARDFANGERGLMGKQFGA